MKTMTATTSSLPAPVKRKPPSPKQRVARAKQRLTALLEDFESLASNVEVLNDIEERKDRETKLAFAETVVKRLSARIEAANRILAEWPNRDQRKFDLEQVADCEVLVNRAREALRGGESDYRRLGP